MTGWERHERFAELLVIGATYVFGLVLDALRAGAGEVWGKRCVAEGKEVRTQTADDPFDEGLEEGCGCEGVAVTYELLKSATEGRRLKTCASHRCVRVPESSNFPQADRADDQEWNREADYGTDRCVDVFGHEWFSML